jgi:hypothetical protein
MLPTMSLLVLALLVVFVVRMCLSMVTRRRERASVKAHVPAQRTPPTSVEQPTTAGVERSGGIATPVRGVPEPITHTSEPTVDVDAELEGDAELDGRVRALMNSGFEAGAVRLLCDELGIGIHDSQQTVRALAGHARADAASQDSASR